MVDVREPGGKLTARARPGIYVGANDRNNCMQVFVLDTQVIVDTLHAVVDEAASVRGGVLAMTPEEVEVSRVVLGGVLDSRGHNLAVADPPTVAALTAVARDTFGEDDGDIIDYGADLGSDINEPTVGEAMHGPDGALWRAAMVKEVATLIEADTWTVVPQSSVPPSARILRSKFVLRVKHDASGSPTQHKARLVVLGCSQVPGVDYDASYAPVARMDAVRFLLAASANKNWAVHQMDVSSAFVNALLDEPVYVYPPPNPGKVSAIPPPGHVLRLNKSLYGLRQAPLAWNQLLNEWLTTEAGLTRSGVDPCIYFSYGNTVGVIDLVVLVWVDDLLVCGPSSDHVLAFKGLISRRFKMTDAGPVNWFLNMLIQRTTEHITVSQERYTRDLLRRFGMADANPSATPLPMGFVVGVPGGDVLDAATAKVYRAVVGSLLYLASCTRPDLAYAVSQLTRHMSSPTKEDMAAAKHALRYLAGTSSLAITYGGGGDLVGYADASFASDPQTRKSTGAYVFLFAGACVAWRSKIQSVVALSTTEAEYIALCDASQEATYLRDLAQLLGVRAGPVTICEDNQPCMHVATNATTTSRTKHIDVKYHYIRECIAAGRVELRGVPTGEQLADGLTKSLAKVLFKAMRAALFGLPR